MCYSGASGQKTERGREGEKRDGQSFIMSRGKVEKERNEGKRGDNRSEKDMRWGERRGKETYPRDTRQGNHHNTETENTGGRRAEYMKR